MALSLGKSNFILFHGSRQCSAPDITEIKVGENSIPRVSTTKYIGLNLDEILSWEKHIAEVIQSLIKYFGTFYNIRNHINTHLARSIYYATIHSRIKYAIEVYGSANKTNIQKLQTIQNKLLKVLLKKDRQFSTDALHNNLNILKVNDIYETSLLNFVYASLSPDAADPIKNFYRQRTHTHNTRHRTDLEIRRFRTEMGRSTTHNRGATLWNNIEIELQNKPSLFAFKRHVKHKYQQKYTHV